MSPPPRQPALPSAVGLYVSSFYLGGTVGGWLPGLGYEAGGWPASLAFVVAMLAIMATIVTIFWREPTAAIAEMRSSKK